MPPKSTLDKPNPLDPNTPAFGGRTPAPKIDDAKTMWVKPLQPGAKSTLDNPPKMQTPGGSVDGQRGAMGQKGPKGGRGRRPNMGGGALPPEQPRYGMESYMDTVLPGRVGNLRIGPRGQRYRGGGSPDAERIKAENEFAAMSDEEKDRWSARDDSMRGPLARAKAEQYRSDRALALGISLGDRNGRMRQANPGAMVPSVGTGGTGFTGTRSSGIAMRTPEQVAARNAQASVPNGPISSVRSGTQGVGYDPAAYRANIDPFGKTKDGSYQAPGKPLSMTSPGTPTMQAAAPTMANPNARDIVRAPKTHSVRTAAPSSSLASSAPPQQSPQPETAASPVVSKPLAAVAPPTTAPASTIQQRQTENVQRWQQVNSPAQRAQTQAAADARAAALGQTVKSVASAVAKPFKRSNEVMANMAKSAYDKSYYGKLNPRT